MYYSTRVMVFFALQIGLVYSFSWDIVQGAEKRLEFYYNGTLTHTELIPSAYYISAVTDDPVHYRVLFADYNIENRSVSSFELSTRTIQLLVTSNRDSPIYSLAYDPVTQLLFWKEGSYDIYSCSLDPAGSSNKVVDGNRIVITNHACRAIAVDSCGGYIYWVTDYEIQRARYDGSERETLINSHVNHRSSLAIDKQTQTLYWTERIWKNDDYHLSIESADLKGKNKTTYYNLKNDTGASSLTVSKDFIYWRGKYQNRIYQLQKYTPQTVEANLYSISHSTFCWFCQSIAANYTIKEQTEKNQKCKTLMNLIPNFSKSHSSDVNVLCVHGTKPSGESRCECTQGYTGEICDVYICQNYCFQGDCSVSAEGQPKCSCTAGYSGERCEVDTCHNYCSNNGVCSLNEEDQPVCECTADYEGARCDISKCKDYCLQGNCSVSAKGQLKCSCTAGFSGERCEVVACHNYCSNNGACSLNEEDEPVCECTADYEGARCDISKCKDYCLQGNCSVSAKGQLKCSCTAGFSGERCEVVACHNYCSNNGDCSLNEEDEPVCECTADYEGARCDISKCKDYCLQGNCSVSAKGQLKCSCTAGFSGERCEVVACHNYCSNNGACSLNEEGEPVCECTADYEGARCDISKCKDYCLQGNCSVSAKGQLKCSCTAGYSGERCEVDACNNYCSNNGVCSLNEEDEPVCECTADYEGEKCDVPTCKDDCVSDEGNTKNRCNSNAGSSAEKKVNACHQYCLNDGNCSLNAENVPVCQCTADYEGERCDVPAFLIKLKNFLYAYKSLPPVPMCKGVESTCASTVV